MKMRQTNAQINDLKVSIKSSIENFELNKPINLHSILHENIGQFILDAIKKELNPDKFEKDCPDCVRLGVLCPKPTMTTKEFYESKQADQFLIDHLEVEGDFE